jgi:hypothetical protein
VEAEEKRVAKAREIRRGCPLECAAEAKDLAGLETRFSSCMKTAPQIAVGDTPQNTADKRALITFMTL